MQNSKMYQFQGTPTVEDTNLNFSSNENFNLKKALIQIHNENSDLKSLNLQSETRIQKLEQEVLALTIAAEYERNMLLKRFNAQKVEFQSIVDIQNISANDINIDLQQQEFNDLLHQTKQNLIDQNQSLFQETFQTIISGIKNDFLVQKQVYLKKISKLETQLKTKTKCQKCDKHEKKQLKMREKIKYLEEQNVNLLKDIQGLIRRD